MMIRNKALVIVLAVSLVSVLGLAACSSSSSGSASASAASSAASSAAASSASSASSMTVVGKQADGAPSFELTNKLGKDIKAIAVKATGDEAYSQNLLDSGATIANGATILLVCPVVEAPAANSRDIAVKALADIEVTLSDGTVYVLHQVDVNGITATDVRVDGDLAYFEYEPADKSDKVSTLESEKAIAQQKADEEAAKASEESDEAGDNEEPAYEEEAYNEDAYYGDDGGTYVDDSAVGSGDEEACIPDIVLRG